MRLIKSNIPTDRKNSFFIKVLSGILVFCLLLVSFVFLLIYQERQKTESGTVLSRRAGYCLERQLFRLHHAGHRFVHAHATQRRSETFAANLLHGYRKPVGHSIHAAAAKLYARVVMAGLCIHYVQRKTVSVCLRQWQHLSCSSFGTLDDFSTQRSFGILQLCPV